MTSEVNPEELMETIPMQSRSLSLTPVSQNEVFNIAMKVQCWGHFWPKWNNFNKNIHSGDLINKQNLLYSRRYKKF